MMIKFKLLAILVLLFFGNRSFAQVELINVTPLSPNAAAIARYGETSVGHFTGVPNISIPIHTIQSGELSLSLSLSYHAGGVKVEDIASWVGLGWSLTGIPVISRFVRNSPDEGTASTIGYFQTFLGQTIAENQAGMPPFQFHQYLMDGVIDGAPDIFSLSLNGKSLKFFYNQQEEKFYTLPLSNVKIEYVIGYGFIVTDDNGDVYYFNERETSSTTANVSTDPITSSWYVSKIVNMNGTDEINFTYQIEAQNIVQIAPQIKYITCSEPPEVSLTSITATSAKRISSISYRGGSVTFAPSTSLRQDLNGGYALSKIQIHNNFGLLKNFDFTYIYSTSQSGGYCDSYSMKRLILDSVTESDAGGVALSPHRFEYLNPDLLPCRLSFTQDYWGFYNGMSSNTSLIPNSIVQIPPEPVEIPGANRTVNPSLSQYGTLKKIHYPTGGHTEFTYENNEVIKGGLVPPNYAMTSAAIEGEETVTTNYYSTEFEIDNPPDIVLNGLAPNGGAFVNIYIGYYGCDLSQGQNICANINLNRIQPSLPAIHVPISGNISSLYLPNGSYKLDALFDQNPPQYANFYAVVEWKIDANPSANAFVGGLRIKEIIAHDGRSTANDIKRRFYYSDLADPTHSSGDIFGVPYFNHVEYEIYWNESQCIRLVANPTAQRVTHSGSYIGYTSVTEEYVGLTENGKTEYTFTMAKDESSDVFPYAAPDSYEYLRGQPVTITYYSKTGADFIPVRKTAYQYTNLMLTAVPNSSVAFGVYDLAPRPPGVIWEMPPVAVAQYQMKTGWSGPSLITETSYGQSNGTVILESTQAFEYTSYMQTKTQTYASSGELKEARMYYPFNINVPESSELIQKNNLVTLIRKENYSNSVLIDAITVEYGGGIPGQGGILPSSVIQQIGNGVPETRIEYLKYNSIGRILDQKKSNDVQHSYVWDETNGLLSAEVKNATSDNIYHTSFEEIGTVETIANPARTGRRYLNTGNYNFSDNDFIPASTTNLMMSYWFWNNNKWNFSGVVNWSNTISSGTRLDEIRVFPGDSQMTTYTYDPGIGMTSMTDANNVTIYYNYDSFGRLKLIKDDKGNVLKQYTYNYKQN